MVHFKKHLLKFGFIQKLSTHFLFSSIGISIATTIWALYLDSFLSNPSHVGFLSSFFTAVGFFSFLFLIPIIEKNSKTKLLCISLIVLTLSYFVFSFYSNLYFLIILGIVISIFGSLRGNVFGIILRDKSKKQSISKNVGFAYVFLNIGWLIAPIFAGYVLQEKGFSFTFLIAAICIFISVLLLRAFNLKDNRVSKRIDKNIFKVSLEFFKNKDRVLAYTLGGAVNFWWALVYIYVPLRIVETGYSDFLVGIFLAAVIIPLVALEYPFGKLAGKKGFKKIFFLGFLISAFFCLLCFFFSNIYIILLLLVLASIGIAMLESTTEAYFFDIINTSQEDKYYGPYSTAVDTGYFLGSISGAIILVFLSFNFIFILFAIFMLITAFLALKIREVLEFKRK